MSTKRLRDKFAAAAVTGILAADHEDSMSVTEAAACAYRIADAMLKERENSHGHSFKPVHNKPDFECVRCGLLTLVPKVWAKDRCLKAEQDEAPGIGDS